MVYGVSGQMLAHVLSHAVRGYSRDHVYALSLRMVANPAQVVQLRNRHVTLEHLAQVNEYFESY